MVAAAYACSLYIIALHEISDNCLGCAFGDPDPRGNVAAANPGIAGDADEDMPVVGKERPVRPCRIFGGAIGVSHIPNGSWLHEIVDRFFPTSDRSLVALVIITAVNNSRNRIRK